MKTIFTFLLALIGFTGIAVAQEQPQPDPKQEEKIQALEIAFISRKLELTPDEAQRFWPVYNDYKKDMRQVMINQKNNPNKDVVDNEQKMIDVRKKYRDRFVGVIGQPRMNKFFQAEREFRGVLLNQLKNRPNKPMLQRRNRN
jgi:hypothetical protein